MGYNSKLVPDIKLHFVVYFISLNLGFSEDKLTLLVLDLVLSASDYRKYKNQQDLKWHTHNDKTSVGHGLVKVWPAD